MIKVGSRVIVVSRAKYLKDYRGKTCKVIAMQTITKGITSNFDFVPVKPEIIVRLDLPLYPYDQWHSINAVKELPKKPKKPASKKVLK